MIAKRTMAKALAGLVLAAVAQGAGAAGIDAEAIRSQQAAIRAEAQAGAGRYAAMQPHALGRLYREQDLVVSLLGDARSTGELDRRRQVALFNALETISAIVNDDEWGRMECRYRAMTGSLIKELVCSSGGELREYEEAVQRR